MILSLAIYILSAVGAWMFIRNSYKTEWTGIKPTLIDLTWVLIPFANTIYCGCEVCRLIYTKTLSKFDLSKFFRL